MQRKDQRIITNEFVEELHKIPGVEVTHKNGILMHHAKDESHHSLRPPDFVAFPEKTREVAALVDVCYRHQVPIIPFGAGTSLEGGVGAMEGGLCIDLSKMNTILKVNSSDMDAVVEAGVTRKTLNAFLRDTGLFFPVDPGADATIGGMAATRASGTNAVRYGTMRENVLNLTAILSDGTIFKSGNRARKSAAGYDLARLMIGSEGTLGIITELTVRLHGLPEAISAAVVQFPSVDAAVQTAILTIQHAIPVARMELLDEAQMRACIVYSGLDYHPWPTLFFEFHGSTAGVREQAKMVEAIADDNGGANFQWADNSESRSKLWEARHNALYAALASRPGSRAWSTDVCVPISGLAECIRETRRDIESQRVSATIVGHVGDGNFHVIFLVDPNCTEEMKAAESVNKKMIERALQLDGTCTGEHGIGIGKRECLIEEMGLGVGVMKQIKLALDPLNIMNPGKIFL